MSEKQNIIKPKIEEVAADLLDGDNAKNFLDTCFNK